MKNKILCMLLISCCLFTGCSGGEKPSSNESTSASDLTENNNDSSKENNSNSSDSTENTKDTTEQNSSTTTQSTENKKIKGKYLISSVSKTGIYFTDFENTEDETLYFISSEDVEVYKEGRTSIFDIIYFYEGFDLEVTGTLSSMSKATQINPEEGTKGKISFIEEYKDLIEDTNGDNINEQDIKLEDNTDFYADFRCITSLGSFTLPGKYSKTITHVSNRYDDAAIDIMYNGEYVCTLSRKDIANGIPEDSDNQKIMYKNDDFYMVLDWGSEMQKDMLDIAKDISGHIKKTLEVIG